MYPILSHFVPMLQSKAIAWNYLALALALLSLPLISLTWKLLQPKLSVSAATLSLQYI